VITRKIGEIRENQNPIPTVIHRTVLARRIWTFEDPDLQGNSDLEENVFGLGSTWHVSVVSTRWPCVPSTMDIILSDPNDSVLDNFRREAENCNCRHRSGAHCPTVNQ